MSRDDYGYGTDTPDPIPAPPTAMPGVNPPPTAPPSAPAAPTAAAAPAAPASTSGLDLNAIAAASGIPVQVLQYWLAGQNPPPFTSQQEIFQASDGKIYRVKRDQQGRAMG